MLFFHAILSALVIQAIVNDLGVTASAGVGVAEKVRGFIMLVPAAFMQSISAFVAQNIGAGKPDRVIRALCSAIAVSFSGRFGAARGRRFSRRKNKISVI